MSTLYFLTTDRLGFREWNAGDLDHAAEIWQDEEVTKYIGGLLPMPQVQARLVTETRVLRLYNIQYWPMFLRATGEFIGCCGLRPYKPAEKIFELGFYIKRACWGKGFATEAAHAVIDHAFNNLDASALFAGHHPANHVSKKVLESLGFHYTHDERYEPTRLQHPSYILEKVNYCMFCMR